jgi:hypothetical protein
VTIASRIVRLAAVAAVGAVCVGTGAAVAQNAVTQPYLMALDTCDPTTPCLPLNKTIYVLQSSDGADWQTLPGFTPFPGSVPTVVRRGNELYLVEQDGHDLSGKASLNAMKLIRYHMDTGIWDAPVLINLTDSGNSGPYIDTDLTLDAQGNIVLVYDTDFGGCAASSCAQHIRIATEVPGSDGGSFIAQTNDAVTIQVAAGGGAGNPYLFFDGSQYILYVLTINGPLPQVSQFAQISVYTSPNIGGPYSLSPALPDGALVATGGPGVSGFYNAARGQYWDYVSAGNSVDQAVVTSLAQQFLIPPVPAPAPCPATCPPLLCAMQQCPPVQQPATATPVITSSSLGLPANFVIPHPKFAKNWNGTQSPVGAVLPLSRSVTVGATATAFVTLINTDTVTAADCFIAPSAPLPATFTFQTTDPATNALTGTANTPVPVHGDSGLQTFVVAITPTAPFAPIEVQFTMGCASTSNVTPIPGVNTLLLSASTTPVPDIVALAATAENDGILHMTGATGSGAFAVATVNVGIGSSITVTARTRSASLPLSIVLCQTNPSTGTCLAAPGANVSATIAANATPTFAIFAAAGGPIPFDPANSRIFVEFTDGDGVVRGETSVAVETQ